MKTFFTAIFLLTVPPMASATIMTCADEIEEMKKIKDKEGLGKLGEQSCKESRIGKKARYKVTTPWKCNVLNDYECVGKPKLKMVQCDREWECY